MNKVRRYWLIKSEIDKYSWDQLCTDKITFWDGIRNYQARNNLRLMRKEDLAFFYHSNVGKEIVGIAKVIKESYQDPTTDNPNWVVVDVTAVKSLPQPVTLAQVKENSKLSEMQLVKNSRLSVQIVQPAEWDEIIKMSKQKKE